MTELYDTLGVSKDASPEDIKKAFRKRASATHPDREGGDAEEFKRVQQAYELLSDPELRKDYDESGRMPGQPPSVAERAQMMLADMLQKLAQSGDIADTLTTIKTNIRNEMKGWRVKIESLDRALRRAESEAKRKDLANPALQLVIKQYIDRKQAERLQTLDGIALGDEALKILADLEEPQIMPQQYVYGPRNFSQLGEDLQDIERMFRNDRSF